jgi:hypothetical protein
VEDGGEVPMNANAQEPRTPLICKNCGEEIDIESFGERFQFIESKSKYAAHLDCPKKPVKHNEDVVKLRPDNLDHLGGDSIY